MSLDPVPFKMCFIVCCVLVVHVTLVAYVEGLQHPCNRQCEWPSKPRVCEYDFTIEWYYTMSKACYNCPFNSSDCYRPHCVPADGVKRPLITANRKFSIRSIQVCHNDQVIVRIHNYMGNAEGISIHWHGLYMKETPYMDGVPMLTQCVIPAYTTFTYDFIANPPGTHWWHAHSGFHRSDGLVGPLIIKRALSSEPHAGLYDADLEQHVIILSDWLHQLTLTKFIAHHHSSGNNKGENILMNGKGVFKEFFDFASNTSYATPREVFEVLPNKRYRFRTISNAALLCPMELKIQDHIMTIIASDGADIKPFNVTSFVLNGGERYDFVLEANKKVSNYWVYIQGIADCRNQSQRAILRYEGAANEEPHERNDSEVQGFVQLNSWNIPADDSHVPVNVLSAEYSNEYPYDQRYSGIPDATHFIGYDFMVRNNPLFNDPILYPITSVSIVNSLFTPQVNNISFTPPSSPMLTQPGDVSEEGLCDPQSSSWNKTKFCEGDFCSCPYVIDIKVGSLVEVVIYDEGRTFESGHPMHLHGQHFMVVAMDKVGTEVSSEEIKEMHANGTITRNFNGIFKDTVFVPDGGYTVVRFLADNPGVWLFHCHLIFHSEIGMELVFRVGTSHDWIKPPKNFPKCGSWIPIKENNRSTHSTMTIGWLVLINTLSVNFMSQIMH